ncbi:bifunctional 3-(3-hydroxy-phenyl)propionate/3-hydroxycinnamic acid hydroxylase [Pseudonocardia saturnea]
MPDVVVVGAGPTGLAVAGLLAQHGVAVTVLDRYAEPYPRPRAVHLDGEAVRVLQRLGVHEQFAAISRPATGLRLLDASLRPFAVFRRDTGPGRHGHPEANLFDQPDLESVLRAALPVPVRGGVDVTGIGDDGGLHVTARHTGTGRLERIPAAAVLGCDGAGSTVRGAVGSRMRDRGFAQRWLVVDLRCPTPLENWGGVDQICDPRRAATFLHLTGDRYRVEFRMHDGESEAGLVDDLAALLAPWVAPGGYTVLRSAGYTFRAQVADRWRRGRVLLLGDAAHLMPPFIGQGLGAGLGDAHNLAWKLAAVLQGRAAEDLLATYRAERAPHVDAVIRTAVRVGRAMTGGNGLLAALRRPAVAGLLRLPGAEERALAGIATRHPPSAWVDRRIRRGDLPGTVCPQPVVGLDGRAVLLDDVLGPGFALLRAGAVDDGLRERARAVGARTVDLAPSGADRVIADDGGLRAWMHRGRVTAVLLRPDRVVAAVTRGR